MNEREEHQMLAAWWGVIEEDSEGYRKEYAQQMRNHYLRLLGMIALDD